MTKIVNIVSGEKYDVYIGRAGHGHDGYYGNPYKLEREEDREIVLEKYRKYFFQRLAEDTHFKIKIGNLQNKVLGCFCKPKLCHGDIIKDYLDNKDKYDKDMETKIYVGPTKKYRIAVVGSRNYNNKEKIYEYLDAKLDKIDFIISGGCPSGGDNIAQQYAKDRGLTILIHYPNWQKDGRGAGFKRNRKIVEDCDVLIAWTTGSAGTQNSIDLANKLNKKVIIHNVEPDPIETPNA